MCAFVDFIGMFSCSLLLYASFIHMSVGGCGMWWTYIRKLKEENLVFSVPFRAATVKWEHQIAF
jgi:hypothetical protein